MLSFMPKYHGYRILVGVVPNVLPPSPLTSHHSLLTAHHSHDITPMVASSLANLGPLRCLLLHVDKRYGHVFILFLVS